MSQIETLKKNAYRVGQCFCLKAILLFTSTSIAAIPPLQFYTGLEQYIEIDLDQWAQLDIMFKPSTVSPEDYIPLQELETGMDQSDLAASILKQSFSTWMDSQEQESVWQTLNTAAKGFSGKIKVQTNKTTHNIKMNFNPVSTKASVKYIGLASTEFSYDIDDKSAKVELSKEINNITYLATHLNNDGLQSDVFGVRWSF